MAEEKAPSVGNVRWGICALLFFATTINYIDRQIIGVLKPDLQKSIGWDEIEYSNIVLMFQFAYAISLLAVGRLIDRIGTKTGFSLSVIWWSIAAAAHAVANSVFGFGAARFALGLGEGGNFPASIKTVAEWFPRKERAFATAVFNSGTNIGAVLTPIIIPIMVGLWGWRSAFVLTGATGFIWLLFWHTLYHRPEEHPRLSAAERDYIRSDNEETKVESVPWVSLLPLRQTWAFVLGKGLTDPIWWLYLFWAPDFLEKNFHLDLAGRAVPVAVIYVVSSVGGLLGGWLSGSFLRRGFSVNASRKITMLIAACAVMPIAFAADQTTMWGGVAIVSLAAAAHQAWSANIFTTVSDMFPKHATASVVGIGGMAGAVGGMIFTKVTGYVLQYTGSYTPMFRVAALAYLVGFVVIHVLAPKLEPVRLKA
jgi:ACS family hexuronate transporter-like MFS transporter